MDFDDLLVRTVDLLERFDDVRDRWQEVFTHLLIDEYQDTNHAQYRIAQLLSARHRNLFAVGDSDQSVYAFRGADIRNILDFERDFSDAAVIRLEQNYRSTQRILDAANAVIAHNANRLEKRLWSDLGEGEPVRVIEVQDEQAEARLVAARIGGLLDEGVAAREIAVFYRTNAQSRVLEDLLVRHGVPYQVIGGARFYERAEIKDAMAYLQALDNPADAVSLRRAINQPRRGIGSSSLERLDALAAVHGWTLWDAITDLEEAGLGTAAERGGARVPHAHRAAPLRDRGARRRRGGVDACSIARASSPRSRPSATRAPRARSRPAAGSRTCRSSSASPRSTSCARRSRRSRGSCRRCPCSPRPTRSSPSPVGSR